MGPRTAWASARSRPGGPSTSRLAARTGKSQQHHQSNSKISLTSLRPPRDQTGRNEDALEDAKKKENSEHELDEEDPTTDDNLVKVVHKELRWGRYFL